MDSEFEHLDVKAPKLLPMDLDRENVNFYINEDDNDFNNVNTASICGNSTSSFTPPFPAFVSPFMTLLASQYTEWRRRNPKELSCAVSQLMSIDSHPCPHENSSCVVISLPNNHVFFGCMNDKTGELVAPKNWDVLKGANDSDKFLIDFRVPSPFKINRECTADSSGKPICQRTNIFHNDVIIAEDAACCCKGDYCADILFDQNGFNPAPFIHIETDESDRVNPSPTNSNEPQKLPLQDPSGAAASADAGFDWDFSPIETAVIICVVIMIIIIVISMGFWFVYEREKAAEKVKNDAIDRETSVFSVDDYPFSIEKHGKRLF
uniref:Uncharacterized protein n=1 Tax=Panagrolaimus sp. ES5 TaxID=591445 RepID=A0AC34F6B3_9BILA